MIVVAELNSRLRALFSKTVEGFRGTLPAVGSFRQLPVNRRIHDVFVTENRRSLEHLLPGFLLKNGVWNVTGWSGEAVRVQNLTRPFRRRIQVGNIGKVFCELDFFVPNFCHARERAFKILLQRIAHGVEFETNFLDLVFPRGPTEAAHQRSGTDTPNKCPAIHNSSNSSAENYLVERRASSPVKSDYVCSDSSSSRTFFNTYNARSTPTSPDRIGSSFSTLKIPS